MLVDVTKFDWKKNNNNKLDDIIWIVMLIGPFVDGVKFIERSYSGAEKEAMNSSQYVRSV